MEATVKMLKEIVEVESIRLDMTGVEAAAIVCVLAKVAGPVEGIRGILNNILDELYTVIPRQPHADEVCEDDHSKIVFKAHSDKLLNTRRIS